MNYIDTFQYLATSAAFPFLWAACNPTESWSFSDTHQLDGSLLHERYVWGDDAILGEPTCHVQPRRMPGLFGKDLILLGDLRTRPSPQKLQRTPRNSDTYLQNQGRRWIRNMERRSIWCWNADHWLSLVVSVSVAETTQQGCNVVTNKKKKKKNVEILRRRRGTPSALLIK